MENKLNGDFIKDLRKQLKMTRVEFGEKIGVSHRTVEGWEDGRFSPRKEAADKIIALSGNSEFIAPKKEKEAQKPRKTNDIKTANPNAYYADCFALDNRKKEASCRALNDVYCITEPCRLCAFYQSRQARREKLAELREKTAIKNAEAEENEPK